MKENFFLIATGLLFLVFFLLLFNTNSDSDNVFFESVPETQSENYYFLVAPLDTNVILFADSQGAIIKKIQTDFEPGVDVELLPSGDFLALAKVHENPWTIGGFGGQVKILDSAGKEKWSYDYFDYNYSSHHDVEMLPNGNVIFLAWDRKSADAAFEAGYSELQEIFPESLIEVNPSTNEIVWEWHSWDHFVQDFNSEKSDFGSISETPQRININYADPDLPGMNKSDLMHANGIDYDEQRDLIFVSANKYSEIWVIDHSTTTPEAASSSGGNYNKGGNLVYRFGNPSAFNNFSSPRLFYRVHYPNIIEGNLPGTGHMLAFSNGSKQSEILELSLPEDLSLPSVYAEQPAVVWSFKNTDLFSFFISGAERLPDGRTLIAEGDYGLWMVSPDSEVLWNYSLMDDFNHSIWRSYYYSENSHALQSVLSAGND